MPSSTLFSRGDVVLVDVIFSNQIASKRRPAVVVSVSEVHRSRSDLVIVPLTTNLASPRFGDYQLSDSNAAGLPRPSLAKGVVQTVERIAISRRLGELNAADLNGVEDLLRKILGL